MQLKHKEAFNAEVIAEQNEKKKLDLNQNKLDAYFKWKKSSEKWKAVTKLIAKWFVKDTRPAGMVQDQGFVNLMGILAPEYDVPCQDTITKYIDTLYIEEHTKVLEELSEIDHCAVTSDGGAASNAMSFHQPCRASRVNTEATPVSQTDIGTEVLSAMLTLSKYMM